MTKISLSAPKTALTYMNPLPKAVPADVVSVRYYDRYWKKSENQPWFLSWNWAAFLFGGLWFYLRRMYMWGTTTLVLELVLTIFIFMPMIQALFSQDPAALIVFEHFPERFLAWVALSFVLCGIFGAVGNALYLRHVRKEVASDPQARGGLNLWLPIVLGIIIMISFDTIEKIMEETLQAFMENAELVNVIEPSMSDHPLSEV